MPRVTTAFVLLLACAAAAAAQVPPLTTTPGPGGIPIAPGAPVQGWTPGGTGIGGSEIAPGPAARSEPMYRTAPGGEPVLVVPPRDRKAHRGAAGLSGEAATGGRPCEGASCLPDGLRITVAASEDTAMPDAISSLATLHAALRACWTPPDTRNMEMSVRFSFRRSGELMAPPFVTYATPKTSPDSRRTFQRSITAALERCAPFRFAREFAAGAAGRPFSVRFVRDPSR